MTVRSPQKRRTKSVQLKTRWHLLVIGWLTQKSLLLLSQLDTQLPLKDLARTATAVSENASHANCGNICVLCGVFIEDVIVWICALHPHLQAHSAAFLLQTASRLIHGCVAAAEVQHWKKVFPFYCSCWVFMLKHVLQKTEKNTSFNKTKSTQQHEAVMLIMQQKN